MDVLRKRDVDALVDVRADVAVTVLCPTDRRLVRGQADRLRLRHLVDEACSRMLTDYVKSVATSTVDALHEAERAIDWRHPLDGVAIFAARVGAATYRVPFPVPERVTVGETFTTRDLMRGFTRRSRYRVLALAQKPARLFEGTERELHEVTTHGFPLVIEGGRGERLESGGAAPHTGRSDAQLRRFFQDVDRATAEAEAGDPLPLVVLGAERNLALFRSVTAHDDAVAYLPGEHQRTSPRELAAIALPAIDGMLAARRAAAVSELAEAVGTGHAAVGVRRAWDLAREGRGRVLLVEEDYRYPARVVDGALEPAADPASAGVVDDAVDGIAEDVVRAGGDVVIVGSGELGVHGPVALVTRF
jgi:hypothetical protein